MKKLVLFIGLVLVGTMATAQSKVGTINVDYILSQMPQMTQVNEELEVYNAELKTNLQDSISKFETLVKAYQQESTNFTEEEKKEKEQNIMQLENTIRGFQQKAGVLLQIKQNQLTKPLYEIINDAMLVVVEEENFTQILNSNTGGLAYATESLDITLKVLDELGIEPTEPEATE